MLKKLLIIISIIGAAGCSSLGVMKKSQYVEKPAANMGLINIVRPNIFLGDGVKFEAWDGTTFIGTLKAGTMLQYNASAGTHCIMIDPTQGGTWATIKIDVKANTTYYVKPNTIPFVGLKLGIADKSDSRKAEWSKELEPYSIDITKTKAVPEKIMSRAASYAASCN